MSATETTAVKNGHFCWTDLASGDIQKAEEFYSQLFGWSVNHVDMGGGRTYTLFKRGEDEICGAYQMSPEQAKMGISSFWTCYVKVKNARESSAKAAKFGATVLVEPFDMGTKGRMSVLQDPNQAIVALWQDVASQSVSVSGTGSICWYELMASDMDVANIFYSNLLGWRRQRMEFPGLDYSVLMKDNEGVGGMMPLPEDAVSNGAIPHWLFYVSVDDCDQTVARAEELGASLLFPATDFENVGRGAILADPTGASVGVLRLNN